MLITGLPSSRWFCGEKAEPSSYAKGVETNIQVITERTDIVCCEATRKCNIEIRLKAGDICQHTISILILVEVSHDAVEECIITTSVTPNILRIIFPLESEAVSISICWKTRRHFRFVLSRNSGIVVLILSRFSFRGGRGGRDQLSAPPSAPG